jgi:arginyl-tRNA synthetase
MFERLALEASELLSPVLGDGVSADFSRTDDVSHGDLTTKVALRMAKELKKSPQEIAALVAEALSGLKGVSKVEIAGAGYVNLWLTPDTLLEELKLTREACKPKKISKKDKPVIVEYSSPNIAKPLGIHHILSTVIGQVIANTYEHAGYNVIHWNYIADWGLQFGKLWTAFQRWESKKVEELTLDDLLNLYVRFHTEAEKDASLEDQARADFKKLEDGNTEMRHFLNVITDTTKQANKKLYDRLHVAFDIEYGEGFYEDKMDAVIEEGKKKKVFKEGEKGALIAEFPEETKLPPYMIVKGDGATLYSTRDLAQMRYRIDTYHPQGIFIVVDIAQKLHFDQLVATCKALGWELPEFEHVIFGRMSFTDAGMSTRKGNIVKLETVLDEAVDRAAKIIKERGESIQTDNPKELAEMMGIGAVVYGLISQNRKSNIVFDWEKMLSFEGNSAPYIQYTHARAKSVLRKAEMKKEAKFPAIDTLTVHERTLIQTLLQFSRVLEESRSEHLPHKLTNFLYSLCQEFNGFYNADSILQAEPPQKELRLALTSLTATVLKTGAELLTLRVPERM